MRGSFEIIREIEIDASPELVFRFLTEPALLERWLCVQAEVDAHPGGSYVLNVTGSHTTRGTFLVVEPGHRLGSLPAPPGDRCGRRRPQHRRLAYRIAAAR